MLSGLNKMEFMEISDRMFSVFSSRTLLNIEHTKMSS